MFSTRRIFAANFDELNHFFSYDLHTIAEFNVWKLKQKRFYCINTDGK